MPKEHPQGHATAGLVDPAGFQAWHAMLRTHVSLLATLERELQQRTGMALTAYEVLVTLHGHSAGRMRMQDLAGAVLLSKSGATRVIGLLEEAGLVVREIPADNRRVTLAVLTDVGRDRIEAAMPVFFGLVHEHFGRHLRPGDARALTTILRRVPGPDSPAPAP